LESIFTGAKAVEHVVTGCIGRMDIPIPEIDFNRIEQRGLPVRAQRVGNVSMLQPEAIILRSGIDRRGMRRCSITSAGREMSRPRLDIVQTTLNPGAVVCRLDFTNDGYGISGRALPSLAERPLNDTQSIAVQHFNAMSTTHHNRAETS
jgi:hypothetical protein